MSARVAELVCNGGHLLDAPGGTSAEALPVGTRLRMGTALVEVTPAPHKRCGKFRRKFGDEALRSVNADPARRLRGVNCRVIEARHAAPGDAIERVA